MEPKPVSIKRLYHILLDGTEARPIEVESMAQELINRRKAEKKDQAEWRQVPLPPPITGP
jgi:hypothetical protein